MQDALTIFDSFFDDDVIVVKYIIALMNSIKYRR